MTNSREKGKKGERELCRVLRSLGVQARRGRQFKGTSDSPDVVTNLYGVHVECKRRETFSIYPALDQAKGEAEQGHLPVVCHRRSRKPWVAIMPLEAFVELCREAGRVGG